MIRKGMLNFRDTESVSFLCHTLDLNIPFDRSRRDLSSDITGDTNGAIRRAEKNKEAAPLD